MHYHVIWRGIPRPPSLGCTPYLTLGALTGPATEPLGWQNLDKCSNPSPYFLQRKRTPGTALGQCICSPLRATKRKSPRRRRIPSRTKSLRARSLDLVPLPTSGPSAPGQIPSEGLPRPRNCPPPQPGAWTAQRRPPPFPLSRVSSCRALRSAVHIFSRFCFLSACVHRDFLLLSQKAPPGNFFFDQIGQFIKCHRPLWAKFDAGCRFREAWVCIRAEAHNRAPMVSR